VTRCVLCLAALLAAFAGARATPPHARARAVEVVDGATGRVLMTVLVTLERARLGDVVTVSPAAVGIEGSTVGLSAGERLTVRDLVKAALIQSANDAANALALYVGHGDRDSFVRGMNDRARALGLADTHFVRPDGLDAPGHVSSADDVTRLARLVMRKPAVRAIVRQQAATIAGGRELHTWNDLLSTDPAVFGVKTGHTSIAGWSEVAAARRAGGTIYATLIGSPSRDERNVDLEALLRWGIARYRRTLLVNGRATYARVETQYGRSAVRLVPSRPLVRVVQLGRPLTERVVAPTRVSLPVRRRERLGVVRIYDGRRLLGSRSLVAARSVARPGVADRLSWYAGRTAHRVWGWVS
jgi:serine-type D-Ala-D-Ala carboxypeptidase (penicillin-binding protein 5/6)